MASSFWARPLANPSEDNLFELRIEEAEFLGFDEDEEGCKVIKTHILLKTRRGPFVARLKRILLGVVKQHRMEVEKSPSGIIDADGWCFGMHGRLWRDIITRLDEIEVGAPENVEPVRARLSASIAETMSNWGLEPTISAVESPEPEKGEHG